MLRTVVDDVSWSVDGDLAETGGEPPPAPAPALPSTLGGQYQLLARLGGGGMGTVFRARDAASGREVALKLLHARADAAQLERFRREGQLTAALEHPGIVRVHAAGEEQGRPYLVYELVEGGGTLAELLRRGAPGEALPRLLEVARAVGHAHRQGVVHRDLKPANVLIDAAGRAVVADFGLASAVGLEPLTQTGGRVGTPHWMAPEQWRRERGPVGAAADVWALGVILYQALTGRHPFPATTLLELEPQVLNREPEPPGRVAPPGVVSPALEAVCLRALAKRPQDRQPDAAALANELEAALRGVAPPRPRRPRRALLAACVPLGGLALLLLLPRGATPPTPAPTEATPVDPPAAAALLVRAQRELAFVERLADPRHVPSPGELPLDERRARATELALQARACDPARAAECERLAARAQPPGSPARREHLARLLELDAADPWGRTLEAEELLAQGRAAEALAAVAAVGSLGERARGRALLALDRPAEALPALQAAAGDRLDARACRDLARALQATGRAPEAAALEARAAALEGAHRAEAAALAQELVRAQLARELPLDEVGASFERALELDPLSARIAFLRATNRFAESAPQEGLRGCAAVLLRAPLALSRTQAWVGTLSQSLRSVQSDLVELLDAPGWTEARPDRLARALLLCGLVELEGRRGRLTEAQAAVDALLTDDPALVAAWTLRGFLALRARDRAGAAQALEVAREACPGCASRTFYEALLLAAEGAPRERVAEALALARQRGDARVEGDAPDHPELAPHRGLLDEVRRRAPPPDPDAW